MSEMEARFDQHHIEVSAALNSLARLLDQRLPAQATPARPAVPAQPTPLAPPAPPVAAAVKPAAPPAPPAAPAPPASVAAAPPAPVTLPTAARTALTPLTEQEQLRVVENAAVGQEVTLTLMLQDGGVQDFACTVKDRLPAGRLTLLSKQTNQTVPFPDVLSRNPIVGVTVGPRADLLGALRGSALEPDLTNAETLIKLTCTEEGLRIARDTAERTFRDLALAGNNRGDAKEALQDFTDNLKAVSAGSTRPVVQQLAPATRHLFRLHKLAVLNSTDVTGHTKKELRDTKKWENCFNADLPLDVCIRTALGAVGVKDGYRIPSGDHPVQV
jgi:hypothetical protein